jgi:hypothetical protein
MALCGLVVDASPPAIRGRVLQSRARLTETTSPQIVSFELPNLYHKSPDSGELQHTPRKMNTAI